MIVKLLPETALRAITMVLTLLFTIGLVSCAPSEQMRERDLARDRGEDFKNAILEACQGDRAVPASELINEPWDRMLIVTEGTFGEYINHMAGFAYMNDEDQAWHRFTGLLFSGQHGVVEFKYDVGQAAAPLLLPSVGQILSVESLSVVPLRAASPEQIIYLEDHRSDCALVSTDDTGE